MVKREREKKIKKKKGKKKISTLICNYTSLVLLSTICWHAASILSKISYNCTSFSSLQHHSISVGVDIQRRKSEGEGEKNEKIFHTCQPFTLAIILHTAMYW